MKSVTLNQSAFKNEIFMAYMMNRSFEVGTKKGFVEGIISSHEFRLDFKLWNEHNKGFEGDGDYKLIHTHAFSKAERELNSIEASDLVNYFNRQYSEGHWAFMQKVSVNEPTKRIQAITFNKTNECEKQNGIAPDRILYSGLIKYLLAGKKDNEDSVLIIAINEHDEQAQEEAKTERNAKVIEDFIEHCKSEGIKIPDTAFESYFGA